MLVATHGNLSPRLSSSHTRTDIVGAEDTLLVHPPFYFLARLACLYAGLSFTLFTVWFSHYARLTLTIFLFNLS